MKSSKEQLDQRGFITDDDLFDLRSISDSELIEKMKSTEPKCRSAAVRMLANRNADCSEKFIDALSVIPGKTDRIIFFSYSVYSITYLGTSGLGPTKLISPFKTLKIFIWI